MNYLHFIKFKNLGICGEVIGPKNQIRIFVKGCDIGHRDKCSVNQSVDNSFSKRTDTQ